MCAHTTKQKSLLFSTPVLYLLAVFAGVLSGMSDIGWLQNIGLIIADIFIKIFKFVSLPIIALSLIVTLASYRAEDGMKNIWQRAIFYTLSTTIIAATISCILYLMLQPQNIQRVIPHSTSGSNNQLSYLQHITNLIPTNIFSPFVEHQVMGVLLIGIVIGIAIRFINDDRARETLTYFFKGAHGLFLVITKWIVAVIPIGLYGFMTTTVIQMRSGIDIRGLGEYLTVIVLANLIQGFIVLPIWLKLSGLKPFQAMYRMLPALSIAFFSKSSAGTLPVTISTVEKNLGVNPRISRFVLPLCTSINMNGCAAFIFATVIYLMQNNGTEISLAMMGLWIVVATIAAVGNAGVPMGCFFLSASLLASMNVPITLMGLILPFYSVIDMIETALNVWSDASVTQVLNKKIVLDENKIAANEVV